MKENGNRNKLKVVRLKTKNGISKNFVQLDTVITPLLINAMADAGTIFVNGVPGVLQHPEFKQGTIDELHALCDIKSINPGIKIFGGGGDFGAAVFGILGEKGVKENFDGILTMGGALLKLISTGELSAMNYIGRKNPLEKIGGIFNYVYFLRNIFDMPAGFWKGKTVNLVVDLNIGDTSLLDTPESVELSELQKVIGIIDGLAFLLKMGVTEINLFSHDGRYEDYDLPKNAPSGTPDPKYSLKNLAPIITVLLRQNCIFGENEKVEFVPDCLIRSSGRSRVKLHENTRFYQEDESGLQTFTQQLLEAHPAHCIINDAIASGHRGDQCSKGGFIGCTKGPVMIGPLAIKELRMVSNIFFYAQKPIVGVFQGNKDDKIPAMKSLVKNKSVQRIIVAGGIYNLFLDGDEGAMEVLKIAEHNSIPIVFPDEVIAAEIPFGMTRKEFIKKIKANVI